jgi:uncharacterized membrane protein
MPTTALRETGTYTNESPSRARPETPARERIVSLDVVRGVIMLLMAIDHVRVYSGLPAGGPTPGIFFTRWITHFVAPGFCFFAGTGAFLHGRKLGDTRALARFLVTRGLLLVVLELTLIRFTWTFNVDYGRFVLAGVIWMLGWCMVLLAGLVRFTPRTVGIVGLAIVFFQQLFHFIPRLLPEAARGPVGRVWEFIYPAGLDGVPGMSILYVLVPWIGVMAAGYGFGLIVTQDAASRRRFCLRVGLGATALFLVVGGALALFGPAGDNAPPFIIRLLNQQKYPASQLFLLMTLGPMIALLPLAERATGKIGGALATFGRVPLFYYLLHIPAIHLAALAVTYLRWGAVYPDWFATAPGSTVPQDKWWSLGLLYLVWAVVVAALYFPCRWFARVKTENRSPWLTYL